jgi:hypothetical protein
MANHAIPPHMTAVTATATSATAATTTTHDEADHDEERAARKLRLFLSEIPTPASQDIVMDRAAWTKMLRSTYTN